MLVIKVFQCKSRAWAGVEGESTSPQCSLHVYWRRHRGGVGTACGSGTVPQYCNDGPAKVADAYDENHWTTEGKRKRNTEHRLCSKVSKDAPPLDREAATRQRGQSNQCPTRTEDH